MMLRGSRARVLALALVACLSMAAFASTASADGPTATAAANAGGPTATAARSCSDSRYRNAYLTNLRTSGTSCSRGKAVARAHTRCRLRKGRRGKCTRRVLGYRCVESDRGGSAQEVTARVSCRKGGARVKFIFSQML